MRILVIEDYEPLRLSLVSGLQAEGYAVDAAADGEEGWWMVKDGVYDGVILDRMLPNMDGLDLLTRLRAHPPAQATPVLMLTAMDQVEDRVAGLDAGADDYLAKPFAVPELLARLRRLLRRQFGHADDCLRCGALALHTASKQVTYDGQALSLTSREFQLLEILMARQGQVVSRQALWEHCYDFASETVSNVLEVLIARLRKKLSAAGAHEVIETRRGQGYVIESQP